MPWLARSANLRNKNKKEETTLGKVGGARVRGNEEYENKKAPRVLKFSYTSSSAGFAEWLGFLGVLFAFLPARLRSRVAGRKCL